MWRADYAHYSMDAIDGQCKSEMRGPLGFKGPELDGKAICSPMTRRVVRHEALFDNARTRNLTGEEV
jgi:hypothetical protein